MNDVGIPISSPAVAAARAITTAAQHYNDGTGYLDAVRIHTSGLRRDELVDAISLLGAVISQWTDWDAAAAAAGQAEGR